MTRKSLIALWGRVALIVAALAIIAVIVAGPLIGEMWAPALALVRW